MDDYEGDYSDFEVGDSGNLYDDEPIELTPDDELFDPGMIGSDGGSDIYEASSLGIGLAGEINPAIEAGSSDCRNANQFDTAHATNQILEVFPTEGETHEMAVRVVGEVGAFVEGKGFDNPPAVDDITVRPMDGSGVAGSYSDGEIVIGNHHNADVNVATAAHEGMHASSFISDWVEVDEVTGQFVHHNEVGIDDIVSVYGADGSLVSEYRDNALLNEGLTESYTEEMLTESGHTQAAEANERSLSYDIATDIAGELRSSFGELADQAYFNGDVGSLRDAFDDASGRPGTFDEVSNLLDRVGNENLDMQERIDSYDRVYELLDRVRS